MQRLDEFMSDALSAYYDSRDPLGADGDFTTAPEISQLFGEIIGIWAVQKWMDIGSPSTFNLVEIGPGRGTLMNDLLRGTKHINQFYNAINIHLVETSSTLKQKQQETLKTCSVQWHDHLSHISRNEPAIIIANEFFDALPIQQFQYNDGIWHERHIKNQTSTWLKVERPPLKETLPPPKDGDIFEYSKPQSDYVEVIKQFYGSALIIDYGYEKSAYGDSLQALYKHAPCSITHHIGNADLTSHIDFEWLSSFFNHTKILTQRQFLRNNGIDIRYQSLNNASLESGYNRLICPEQMGELFKVLDITLQSA